MRFFFLLGLLFSALISSISVSAAIFLPWNIAENIDNGFLAPMSGSKDVDTPEGCRRITGVGVSQSYFAPTKTVIEWNAFKANKPAGFTIGACMVSGACGNSAGTCSQGNVTGDSGPISGTANYRTWTCTGQNGGANVICSSCYPDKTSKYEGCYTSGIHDMYTKRSFGATVQTNSGGWMFGAGSPRCFEPAFSCAYGVPPVPVNGSCNNSTPLGCSTGTATSDNGQTSCNTTRTWTCNGQNGGSNSPQCSRSNGVCPPNPINGVCGSYHGQTYEGPYTWGTVGIPGLCSSGTPIQGSGWPNGPWNWSCQGSNGGSTVNCSANKYTYSWNTSAFGSCSVSCGPGTQTRNVTCRRSDAATVADSYCTGAKPTASQSCNMGACPISCTLPWGGTIPNGASVVAYSYNQGFEYAQKCFDGSMTRTCVNGILNNPNHWWTGLPMVYSSCATIGECPVGQVPLWCADSGGICGCTYP